MTDLLTALALVLVIEGVFLALFAGRVDWFLKHLAGMPPEALRIGGVVSAVIGVFCVWLLRG